MYDVRIIYTRIYTYNQQVHIQFLKVLGIVCRLAKNFEINIRLQYKAFYIHTQHGQSHYFRFVFWKMVCVFCVILTHIWCTYICCWVAVYRLDSTLTNQHVDQFHSKIMISQCLMMASFLYHLGVQLYNMNIVCIILDIINITNKNVKSRCTYLYM